jgi:hypothetical protein
MDGSTREEERPFGVRLEPSKSQRLRPPSERKSIEGLVLPWKRGSEVDLMTALYPLSVHRRIERHWPERIKSLRQIHGQIVVGTRRTLQPGFNNVGSQIGGPVLRAIVDQLQLDQSRPLD